MSTQEYLDVYKRTHLKTCYKIPRNKVYTLGCSTLGIREQIELSKEPIKAGNIDKKVQVHRSSKFL